MKLASFEMRELAGAPGIGQAVLMKDVMSKMALENNGLEAKLSAIILCTVAAATGLLACSVENVDSSPRKSVGDFSARSGTSATGSTSLPSGSDGGPKATCKPSCMNKPCAADDGCGHPCAKVPKAYDPSFTDNFDFRKAANDGSHFDCRQGSCGCGADENDNDNMECEAHNEGGTWKGYCRVNCPGACVHPPALPLDAVKGQYWKHGYSEAQMREWAVNGTYPGSGVEQITCLQIFRNHDGGAFWNGDRPRVECLPIGN